MNVIGHEVGLLNRGVTRQPGGRIFRIEDRHRTAPGLTRGKLHATVLHPDVPTGMGHKEPVAADTDRECHIVFLTDHKSCHDEIIHVLLVFSMEHDHAVIDKIGDFDVVRLNG